MQGNLLIILSQKRASAQAWFGHWLGYKISYLVASYRIPYSVAKPSGAPPTAPCSQPNQAPGWCGCKPSQFEPTATVINGITARSITAPAPRSLMELLHGQLLDGNFGVAASVHAS